MSRKIPDPQGLHYITRRFQYRQSYPQVNTPPYRYYNIDSFEYVGREGRRTFAWRVWMPRTGRADALDPVGSREWREFINFSSIENLGIDECWIRCAVRCSCSSMIPRSPRGLSAPAECDFSRSVQNLLVTKFPGTPTLNKPTQPWLAVAPSRPLRLLQPTYTGASYLYIGLDIVWSLDDTP
jgi:hypothetical protein